MIIDRAIKERVKDRMINYLEHSKLRKTPERFAILDTIYDIEGPFSIDELNQILESRNFHVSRATLYSAVKLFMEMRVVVRHKFNEGVRYEAYWKDEDHTYQICKMCGRTTEIDVPLVTETLNNYHYRRFRKEGFSLYVYGLCSSCRALITKKNNIQINKKKRNSN